MGLFKMKFDDPIKLC